MDIKRNLLWFIRSGITECITENPTTKILPATDIPTSHQASSVAVQATSLDELNASKQSFEQCPLRKTAAHTLLGRGITKPKLMCIVVAPNTDSDKSGTAFDGQTGQLLARMLKAIHLTMDHHTYCTYLSPWRAPGNRDLTESEIATLKPFLDKEIDFVQPQIILLFGSQLSKALLDIDSLSKARHIWHTYHNIPTRVSLSLDTIKTTTQRQQAWEDLQEIQKKLDQ